MIKIEDLKLNQLILIDEVCEKIEIIQKNLLKDTPYLVFNRHDMVDLLNMSTRERD